MLEKKITSNKKFSNENLERRYFYLDLHGKYFHPSKAESETKLILYDKLEPKEPIYFLSKHHPEYGKPSKYGNAIIQPPINIKNQIKWLLKTLDKYYTILNKLGVTKIIFWEVCYLLPETQRNFELDSDEMEILSTYKTSFCLSVYDLDLDNIESMSQRFHNNLYRNVK